MIGQRNCHYKRIAYILKYGRIEKLRRWRDYREIGRKTDILKNSSISK